MNLSILQSTRSVLVKVLPWLITIAALYYAFNGVDWHVIYSHLGDVRLGWIFLAIGLTSLSYLLRARRWQSLFPTPMLKYDHAVRVLILGFFMNNVLPARAGELVRAHMGAKLANAKRTLVLATIASERLIDALTISLFFLVFAFHLGDAGISSSLAWVALAFFLVALVVLLVLSSRARLLALANKVSSRIDHKASHYTYHRLELFLDGLSPLTTKSKFPRLAFWSIVIWSVELCVYWAVAQAYASPLGLAECVLFLVAVNFSSLIPAAPGGIGVIEAVGSAVLVSIAVPKELALTMVITQHAIQYLIVGIPGAIVMLTWQKIIRQVEHEQASTPASTT